MALGNLDWTRNFPQEKLFHLVQAGSDHCPILLTSEEEARSSWRPFKLFAMWMKHFFFSDLILKLLGIWMLMAPQHFNCPLNNIALENDFPCGIRLSLVILI